MTDETATAEVDVPENQDVPQDVEQAPDAEQEAPAGVYLTPTQMFARNFAHIMYYFKTATDHGQSVKAANLTTLFQEACDKASIFTQIEIQQINRNNEMQERLMMAQWEAARAANAAEHAAQETSGE